jgi:ArsR family transcriptional regulator
MQITVESFAFMCKYKNMKDLEHKKLISLFKALSDENRLGILAHLCLNNSCNCNVSSISSCCDVDISVVSRHLSKLKAAGVLRAHKEGKEVFYNLEGKYIAKQLRALADYIEKSSKC